MTSIVKLWVKDPCDETYMSWPAWRGRKLYLPRQGAVLLSPAPQCSDLGRRRDPCTERRREGEEAGAIVHREEGDVAHRTAMCAVRDPPLPCAPLPQRTNGRSLACAASNWTRRRGTV